MSKNKDDEIKALKDKVKKLEEEQTTKKSKNKRTKKKDESGPNFFGCFLIVMAVIVFFGLFPSGDSAKTESEEAEEKIKGFHCLSSWDGSHTGLVSSVKNQLRNPSSFEHVSTRIGRVNDEGKHFVRMTYRAQNGFGGTNVESASGVISNSSCSLLEWSND